MKTFSRIALTTALLAGISGIAASAPAYAKKDEKPAKGSGLVLSDAVRKAVGPAQTSLAAKDIAASETNVAAVEAAAKTDDEHYVADTLRVQLLSIKNAATPGAAGNAAFAAPLDRLIANPKTPKDDLLKFLSVRADIAFDAKDYPTALKYYSTAKQQGLVREDLSYQIVQSKIESGDAAGGAADLDALVKAETAAGRKPPERWYRYAVSSLMKSNKPDETATWTAAWLSNYGTKENWRTAIYTFGFQGASAKRLSERQRVDLYRLMRATHSLTDRGDYLSYADSSLKIGLPTEAKSAIEEGNAANILPASNMDGKDFLNQATRSIQMDKPLAAQEASAASAPNGRAAAATGDAYLGARNYQKAAQMYEAAQQKGGVVDADALALHYGIALALAGDKDKARTAFGSVKTAPNTEIAKLWVAYLAAPVA